MHNRLIIFLFSGTGNTAFVADLLVGEFARAGVSTDLVRIEDIRRTGKAVSVEGYDLVGIAHPVLGFDCPAMIYDFVRSLPPAAGQPVFLVKTAADYHRVNFGASKSISKILSGKGYRVFFDDLFAMPSNWLIGYPDDLSRSLVEAARTKSAITSSRILAQEEQIPEIGFLLRWTMRGIGFLEDRYGSTTFGRHLRAGEACTNCGSCVRDCPSGNIEEKDGHIRFGDLCIWCMRCIYACPAKAIDNRYMNMFILKEGYSLARLATPGPEPLDAAGGKPGFWDRYFRRYFAQIGDRP